MRGQPGFFDIDDRLKRLSDLEHDPEKWKPVFGQDHAQSRTFSDRDPIQVNWITV